MDGNVASEFRQENRPRPTALVACLAVDNRACIFCSATGAEVKITREHTFPN